ncbi:MAG TPA: hypothetical protein VNK95_02320, partial [Caldilineaceae bacterium]|nr:hypothetical protein [Caldilineaceae bacterium]
MSSAAGPYPPPSVAMPACIPVVLDIGPAVHQRAGLSRYAERLAATLLDGYQDQVALRLVYNAHSGHRPPPTLHA